MLQQKWKLVPTVSFGLALLAIGEPSRACSIDVTAATPGFRAAAGGQHSGLVDECAGAPPVTAYWDSAVGFSYSQVYAEVEVPGQVQIENYSRNVAYGWPYGEYHFMDGEFFLPDLIITGGPGPAVDTALNVTFGGSWVTQSCSGSCPEGVGGSWRATARQADGSVIASTGNQPFDYTIGAPDEVASAALLGLPVGTTFGLSFTVRFLNVGVDPGTTIQHAGFMEFLASPVFDLPDGYTLDSESGNIEDNSWTALPEPGAHAALASGALLTALLQRRRRARPGRA